MYNGLWEWIRLRSEHLVSPPTTVVERVWCDGMKIVLYYPLPRRLDV